MKSLLRTVALLAAALAVAAPPGPAAALGPGALALRVPVDADPDAAPEAAPPDAPAAQRLLRGLEGSYGSTTGDLLEIAPYGPDAVFFRVRLTADAAPCAASGVARIEDDRLAYERAERGQTCRVEIALEGGEVTLRAATGPAPCVARGACRAAPFRAPVSATWPHEARRRLRDPERLRRARDFELAAVEYERTPSELVRDLAGVYRTRSRHVRSGGLRRPQDVLEIVPNGRDSAFITVHLKLPDGQRCDLEQELATVEGGKLAYVDYDGDWFCRLEIGRAGDKVVLRDTTTRQDCKAYCGARALMAAEWPYARRRPER